MSKYNHGSEQVELLGQASRTEVARLTDAAAARSAGRYLLSESEASQWEGRWVSEADRLRIRGQISTLALGLGCSTLVFPAGTTVAL